MIVQHNHLARNAQNALQNHLHEQEERRKALAREQHIRDLRQLETNLFHKQQEVKRINVQLERLKRELVTRESKFKNSIQDTQHHNHVKEIERQLGSIDQSLKTKLNEITQKIDQKQRELDMLEKQKQEFMLQTQQQKKTLESNIKVAQSQAQSTIRYKEGEKRLFEMTQKQIDTLEHSAKAFGQDITVLENKIKALKVTLR